MQGISWGDSEERRRENISKLLKGLDESLNTEVWENLFGSEHPVGVNVFTFFMQRGVSLGAVGLGMSKEIRTMKDLLSNVKTRELIENELIKDEYYAEMIWEEFKEDDEEDYEF